MNQPCSDPNRAISRRHFLQIGSSALMGTTLLGALPPGARRPCRRQRSVEDGRGRLRRRARTGATSQALSTTGATKLVVLADVRPEQLEKGLNVLKGKHEDQVAVPPERQFTDFDGYQKAIALADVVIMASSPGFRPIHFEEAVRQGKHVFMEKPVATGAPGIRRVLAAAEEAKRKNLKVGGGLQRRHHAAYLETVKRIQDGAVGDIMLLRAYWDGGSRDGVEPAILIMSRNSPSCESVLEPKVTEATPSHPKAIY